MKSQVQLTLVDSVFVVAYSICFGACLTLMSIKGANGYLVALAVGASLGAFAKLGLGYHRGMKAMLATPPTVRSAESRG